MTKYRIKQCGENLFIPQYRFLFMWEKFCTHRSPMGGFGTKSFKTLEDAKLFIDEKIAADIESDNYNKSLKPIKYHKHP